MNFVQWTPLSTDSTTNQLINEQKQAWRNSINIERIPPFDQKHTGEELELQPTYITHIYQ